jgi:predicted MFS family arabinose efflux permease
MGMTIMAISMMLLGYLAGSIGSDPRLLLLTFVSMGIGGVFFQSPNNTEIMRALPRSKINIASSFTATIRNLGMALGVSFAGVLVSLQLFNAGYYGTLVEADPGLIAATISRVMMLAGILCIIGALVSIYRGLSSAKF